MIEYETKYEYLTKSDKKKLLLILRGVQGNMSAAERKSGLTQVTLKKAAAGMKIRKNTAEIIRTVLLNQKLQTISQKELSEG